MNSTFNPETVRNGYYRIVPDAKIIREWNVVPVVIAKNNKPKTSGVGAAGLGLPRMFAQASHSLDFVGDRHDAL